MEDIIPYIQTLYAKSNVEKIVTTLSSYTETLPQTLVQKQNPYWYKESTIYAVYPDSLQLTHTTPLQGIRDYLPQIKELGCNGVHLLPFLKSPMQDKGFDVSDYYKIREGLGGIGDLKEVIKTADKLGISLFMDLIFNHVSTEHEWFVKAQNGSEYYRNFFIHTKDTPQFLGNVYKHATVYAEYLINGEKNLVSVAFPEFAGELPHWVRGKDGYWYYHTYYPSQIDLDWRNPEVFIECTKVLLYWASLGFNFRLDAIPFVGKPAYKHLNTHNTFTHHLTAVFPVIAKHVNPQSIFILETNEHMDSEIEYFGNENIPQAHMLYSFHLTAALWMSIIEHNANPIWRQLEQDKKVPAHSQWINFLRNHDEISFANASKKTITEVHKKLLPFGKSFRSGYGIAGRTYSLLGSDEKRFLMAYFLLISLPGSILIPYGDEYGLENVPLTQLSSDEQIDARNINRGHITDNVWKHPKSKRIFAHMSAMLQTKQLLKNYLNVWPQQVVSQKGVFAEKYKLGTSELMIFINLTKFHKTIPFDLSTFEEVATINTCELTRNEIKLGPYGGIWLQK